MKPQKLSLISLKVLFIVFTSVCSKPTAAQTPGTTLLNVTYENGATNSGIAGVNPTNATASDAVYMVSPGATGNYAVAHKVVHNDAEYFSDGNWRSESDAQQFLAARFYPGDERRYEFSVLLKDWTPWNTGDPIDETNIFQLKMSGGGEVPLQIRTQRNAMRLRFATANSMPVVDIIPDVRPYVNEWIQFRIDVLWSSSATGYMKTYMKLPGQSDYVLVDEKTNYLTYNDGSLAGQHGYVKWGLYVLPPNTTRIAYHDDIRVIALNEPAPTVGLIWGNGISDPNPAYLDGPYTKAANIANPTIYNNTSNVYIHPNIKYEASQNIVYFNSASPAPNPGDNVIGTPRSDFSRTTLAAAGMSGGAPGPSARYLLGGWAITSSESSPTELDPDRYYEFHLEPKEGYYINFSDIRFTLVRGAATAPNTFVMRSSLDNFATNISTPITSATTGSGGQLATYDLSSLSNVTGPVSLRLYAYGATATSGSPLVGINDLQIYGLVQQSTLPVTFANISAKFLGKDLQVAWSTASETNNSYFEIQTSADGRNFVTVKTVNSANGDTDAMQNYKVTIPGADIPGMVTLSMAMLLLGFANFKKHKTVIRAIGFGFLMITSVSCSLHESALLPGNENVIYLRIKQVDVDGKTTYSKIVSVSKKH